MGGGAGTGGAKGSGPCGLLGPGFPDGLGGPGGLQGLSGLGDLLALFDEPHPNPPSLGPPYTGGPPTIAGELDPAMAGRPLWELCARATGLGPDEARALVAFGAVWLGRGVALDPGHPLPAKGAFRVNFPAYGPREFYEPDPGRVAFEDKDILVYRKEANRPSQAVPYDARNNVLAGLTRQRGVFLRLAHRLDLGTSGLLLLAKSLKAAGFLGKSFQRGQIAKRYLALSSGPPPPWDETEVTAPIARVQNRFVARENGPGLPSRTILRPLAAFEGRVLFLATPRTGRTHQIRLHLSHLGYPIVGDCFYGGAPHPRLMLAASGLAFRHPSSREPMALGGPWGGDPPDLG